MGNNRKVAVLFVCMGNICRSPTAQGVFSRLVRDEGLEQTVSIDSAGTHAYHVGEPPDRRAQAAALTRSIDLSDQQARQVTREDFTRFDYVVAMDRDNQDILSYMCPADLRHKIHLFLDFAAEVPERDVPDPYYGGADGFERVLDLAQAAARGLLDHIRKSHSQA